MKSYAINNVCIIDGTGSLPIENGFMIVEGAKIKSLGTELPKDFTGDVLDYSGKTLVPGIIDCHNHQVGYDGVLSFEERIKEPDSWRFFRAINNVHEKLKSGVTYIRDCGSGGNWNIELRDAIKAGIIEGPDIVACGQLITMTGGHGSVEGSVADGVDEVRKATRASIKAGVDQIKIVATGGVLSAGTNPGNAQYDFEELEVAVKEARKVGKRVLTHAHGVEGVMNALRADIDSIEHGMFLNKEAIDIMVEQGTYLVPTLVAPYWIVHGSEVKLPKSSIKKAKLGLEAAYKSFQMAHKAGVKIAMGTDSGTPCNFHSRWYKELELYVRLGMSNMEAILTATKTASELLEINNDYGSLEVGKNADFLILDENPLDNILAYKDVKRVYKNGRLVTL